MIDRLKTVLAQFGKVEECEIIDDELRVLITDGFSQNARRTFECLKLISDHDEEHTIVKKMKSEDNHFRLILSKSKYI